MYVRSAKTAAHVRLLLQSFRLSAWHSSEYRGRQVCAILCHLMADFSVPALRTLRWWCSPVVTIVLAELPHQIRHPVSTKRHRSDPRDMWILPCLAADGALIEVGRCESSGEGSRSVHPAIRAYCNSTQYNEYLASQRTTARLCRWMFRFMAAKLKIEMEFSCDFIASRAETSSYGIE